MPYSSQGVFTPEVTFVDDTVATAEDQNTQDADIATGLTQVSFAAGLAPAPANLRMGNFKLTGLAAGTAANDAVNYGQITPILSTGVIYGGTSTGSANAQAVAATSYTANPGAGFTFIAGFTTGAGTVVLTVNGQSYQAYQPSSTGPTNAVLYLGDLYLGFFNPSLNSNVGGYQVVAATTLLALGVSAAMVPVVQAASVVAASGAMGLAFGQCYFQYQTTTKVQLVPQGGSYITIAGVDYAIPAAGISATITSCHVNGVAGQSLVASTLYYAYLYNNSGILTLDFSTTGHATDTTAGNVGVEIKSGDNTRSLVGMVKAGTGPVLANSGEIDVLSWFNRCAVSATSVFAATSPTRTSATYGELDSSIRLNILTWGREAIQSFANGYASNPTAAATIATTIAFDSATSASDGFATGAVGSDVAGTAQMNISYATSLSEGSHFITLLGQTSGGTATWHGVGGAGNRFTLGVTVRG